MMRICRSVLSELTVDYCQRAKPSYMSYIRNDIREIPLYSMLYGLVDVPDAVYGTKQCFLCECKYAYTQF